MLKLIASTMVLSASAIFLSAPTTADPLIQFNNQDELLKPANYREWVYIGTGLTPHDLNNGNASFPEFHNVYLDPEGWAYWKKHGSFGEGSVVVKELMSVGDREAVSGKGYFQGEFSTIAVMVKDRQRFTSEPGNWGFYIFFKDQEQQQPSPRAGTKDCAQCHVQHAKLDHVFTQYYPILRAASPLQPALTGTDTFTSSSE